MAAVATPGAPGHAQEHAHQHAVDRTAYSLLGSVRWLYPAQFVLVPTASGAPATAWVWTLVVRPRAVAGAPTSSSGEWRTPSTPQLVLLYKTGCDPCHATLALLRQAPLTHGTTPDAPWEFCCVPVPDADAPLASVPPAVAAAKWTPSFGVWLGGGTILWADTVSMLDDDAGNPLRRGLQLIRALQYILRSCAAVRTVPSPERTPLLNAPVTTITTSLVAPTVSTTQHAACTGNTCAWVPPAQRLLPPPPPPPPRAAAEAAVKDKDTGTASTTVTLLPTGGGGGHGIHATRRPRSSRPNSISVSASRQRGGGGARARNSQAKSAAASKRNTRRMRHREDDTRSLHNSSESDTDTDTDATRAPPAPKRARRLPGAAAAAAVAIAPPARGSSRAAGHTHPSPPRQRALRQQAGGGRRGQGGDARDRSRGSMTPSSTGSTGTPQALQPWMAQVRAYKTAWAAAHDGKWPFAGAVPPRDSMHYDAIVRALHAAKTSTGEPSSIH